MTNAPPKHRILVVDDEAELRMVVRMTADAIGAELIEAANGLEALSLVRREKFDAIVSDLKMPKMDGIEFLKTLRREKIKTNVVIVSGFVTDEDIAEAKTLGVHGIFVKPYDFARFETMLKELLKKPVATT